MTQDTVRINPAAMPPGSRRGTLRGPAASLVMQAVVYALLTVAVVGDLLTCGRGGVAPGSLRLLQTGDCGRADSEARLLRQIQRIDLPVVDAALRAGVGVLSPWAVAVGWAMLLLVLGARHLWSAAAALLLIPLGVGIGALVERTLIPPGSSPADTGLGGPDVPAWPLTVLLGWGLLVGALAATASSRLVARNARRAVVGVGGAAFVLVALETMRRGWLWPSDIMLVLTLGATVLTARLGVERRLSVDRDGLPRAGAGRGRSAAAAPRLTPGASGSNWRRPSAAHADR